MIALLGTPDYFLEDGATLSVTQNADPCTAVEGSESELPEKFSVPPELRSAPPDASAIKLRSIRSARILGGKPAVRVSIVTNVPVYPRNSDLIVQIGRQEFPGWIGAETVIPYEEFAQIPDNSQVILKWGRCTPGGTVVGRLNKSALDH